MNGALKFLRENWKTLAALVAFVLSIGAWINRAEIAHADTAQVQKDLAELVRESKDRDVEHDRRIQKTETDLAAQKAAQAERERIRRCLASGKSPGECI